MKAKADLNQRQHRHQRNTHSTDFKLDRFESFLRLFCVHVTEGRGKWFSLAITAFLERPVLFQGLFRSYRSTSEAETSSQNVEKKSCDHRGQGRLGNSKKYDSDLAQKLREKSRLISASAAAAASIQFTTRASNLGAASLKTRDLLIRPLRREKG